jgi:hypothetical protein
MLSIAETESAASRLFALAAENRWPSQLKKFKSFNQYL